MGILEVLPPVATLLVTLTAFGLLTAVDWRISLGCLALQYLGIFILIGEEWTLVMALTRLVAGWMAAAVLGMAIVGLPQDARRQELAHEITPRPAYARRLAGWFGAPPGALFYLLTTILVILASLSQITRIIEWVPGLGAPEAWGGLTLIGLGLLKLGFWNRPFQAILGLMTMFSGFELLYAAINPAPLAAALTSSVTLGLALVGAYLVLAPHMEPNE